MKHDDKVNKTLPDQDVQELTNRVKAMSREELDIVINTIPVELCMLRIQRELDKAAEIQSSIERAYEMVKQ